MVGGSRRPAPTWSQDVQNHGGHNMMTGEGNGENIALEKTCPFSALKELRDFRRHAVNFAFPQSFFRERIGSFLELVLFLPAGPSVQTDQL